MHFRLGSLRGYSGFPEAGLLVAVYTGVNLRRTGFSVSPDVPEVNTGVKNRFSPVTGVNTSVKK